MNGEEMLPVHLWIKLSLDYDTTLELYEKRNENQKTYSYSEFITEIITDKSKLSMLIPMIEKRLGRSTFIDFYFEEIWF